MDILADTVVKKIVAHRAAWVAACCPLIDFDDAQQEMWKQAVLLVPRYCESSGAEFSTFLYSHLRFRSINLIRTLKSRARIEAEWAVNGDRKSVDPPSEVLDNLVERIKSPLCETDRRVFDLLINPPEELQRIERICNADLKRDQTNVSNKYLALYLKVSEMTISRSIRHIQDVTERVMDGEVVRWRARKR
jgi:DNA-directed RNA polymerase specialized sigma24 family protein